MSVDLANPIRPLTPEEFNRYVDDWLWQAKGDEPVTLAQAIHRQDLDLLKYMPSEWLDDPRYAYLVDVTLPPCEPVSVLPGKRNWVR